MALDPQPRARRFGCGNCFFTLLLLSLAGPELLALLVGCLGLTMAVAWGALSLVGTAALGSLGWFGRHPLLSIALLGVALEGCVVAWILRHSKRGPEIRQSARARREVLVPQAERAPVYRGLSPAEPDAEPELDAAHGLSRPAGDDGAEVSVDS